MKSNITSKRRLTSLKSWRSRKIVWTSICLCALTFSVARGAHTPVITPVVCKWYDEEVIIVPAGLSPEDKSKIDELLKALVEATGVAIGPEVAAVKKAINALAPGRENIDVIIIYACKDNLGVIHRRKQTLTLDGGENMPWWPNTRLAAGDVARDKETLIKKYSKPGESCCKATPTPTPTPTPPPPTPTLTPKPTPPRTYTGPAQSPTPTPQEHGMAPRQPGKTGETCAVLIATGKINAETSGTGETIGHIADLKIQNLTDQPLTCAIPPMILESGSGKNQHYACPTGQTVALNPHQTQTVPMNGVCLNRNRPPVGKGVSGDLVVNEANPSGPQNPNSHLPATDAGKLLRSCAAKYTAADQLQKSGALKNLPYHDPQKQKDIVVQWSTWTDPQICQIVGTTPATKDDLKKVVYKQVEEKGSMSRETKKKVDQGIDAIFEKVELTTAKAKDLEKPESENFPPAQTPAG